MPALSILIPTYNRCEKLKRLLDLLGAEIESSGLKDKVTVFVSDNGSTDKTSEILSSFSNASFTLKYFRQTSNIGFDRNVRFLYERFDADYGWFFSDDDIPLPGAINKVLAATKGAGPDVLLFSFIQPPDSKVLTFNYQEHLRIIDEPTAIIELIPKYPKISIYVMRKVVFSSMQWGDLDRFIGNGFYFLNLAYSVLGATARPRVGIISEPLARCDEDYLDFNFIPKVIFEMYKVFTHPFVTRYIPDFAEKKQGQSYRSGIQFLFAMKIGTMTGGDMQLYDRTIRVMPICPKFLITNPKSLFQLLAMKLGISEIYNLVKPAVSFARSKIYK